MKPPYEYTPLQPRFFRLIHLHPSPLPFLPLKFTLLSTPIDANPPSYIALSYTWDGQTPDQKVWCDDKLLHVTANAAAAMRALRRTLHPVYLWVDAICINQASLPEKGEQVAMMADIYRSAEHVAIWLGDLAFSAAPLARVIWGGWWEAWVDKRVAAAGREKIEDDEKWWRHLLTPGPAVWGYYAARTLCLIRGRAKEKAKEAIHGHRYWSRIWTVQEVRLAKKAIVYNKNVRPAPLSVYTAIIPDRYDNEMHMPRRRGRKRVEGSTDRAEFAFELLSKKASVPHDLIFGLIAVYPDVLGQVQVDYQRPLPDVFEDLTRRVLTTRSVWAVLHLAGLSAEMDRAGEAVRSPGLPSWCPDWHQLSNSGIGFPLRGERFQQECEYTLDEVESVDDSGHSGALSVHARWIGQVGFVGSPETPLVKPPTVEFIWKTQHVPSQTYNWIFGLGPPLLNNLFTEPDSLLIKRYEAAITFLTATGLGREWREGDFGRPEDAEFPWFVSLSWRPEHALRILEKRSLFEFYYTGEGGPEVGMGAGRGLEPGDKIFCLAGDLPKERSLEDMALGFAVRETVCEKSKPVYQLVGWVMLCRELCNGIAGESVYIRII